MRLFVALDIDEEIRKQIEQFIEEVRGLAPDVRWVTPESLHVTLKFIGEKPEAVVAEIEKAVGLVSAEAFEISFRGHGFFPTAKAARDFWEGIEGDDGLTQLSGTDAGEPDGRGHPEENQRSSPQLLRTLGGDRIRSR